MNGRFLLRGAVLLAGLAGGVASPCSFRVRPELERRAECDGSSRARPGIHERFCP